MGATGKSAQIPLYTWLPDAMEGPHAGQRTYPCGNHGNGGRLYDCPMQCTVYVVPIHNDRCCQYWRCYGALCGIHRIGAKRHQTSIGLFYNQSVRIYVCGLWCGAFTAGIFHLMTHAFFKALLFLGSGSVIHALSGEQDMRKMGGLRHHIPTTYKTFLVGTVAIAGIPPFAGFFSKDEILLESLVRGNFFYWAIGALAAFFTAFTCSVCFL